MLQLVDPEQFTKNLELLRVFTSQEHRMPRNLELYKGIRLGQWCVVMRRKKKLGVLAQQQVEALESVEHWKWDVGYQLEETSCAMCTCKV